jgi:hypothetical protein
MEMTGLIQNKYFIGIDTAMGDSYTAFYVKSSSGEVIEMLQTLRSTEETQKIIFEAFDIPKHCFGYSQKRSQ